MLTSKSQFMREQARAKSTPSPQPTGGGATSFPFPFKGSIPISVSTQPNALLYLPSNIATEWVALNLKANCIARTEWIISQDLNGTYSNLNEEMPNHWLVKMTHNPSYFRTRMEVFRLFYKWMKLTGTAYAYIQRRIDWNERGCCPICDTPLPRNAEEGDSCKKCGIEFYGMPFAIFPLESGYVRVIPDTTNSYDPAYQYITPYGVFNYKFADILVWRNSEPTNNFTFNLFYGTPEPAYFNHLILSESKAYYSQDAFLSNIARPSLFITNPPVVESMTNNYDPVAAAETFRAQWREDFEGAGNSGKVAFGTPGQDVKVIDVGGHEVNFLETTEALRRSIATSNGTPLTMLDGQYANRATAEVVVDNFREMHLEPDVIQLAQTLEQWAQLFDPTLRVSYRPLTSLRPDVSTKLIQVLKAVPGAINGNIAGHIAFGDKWTDTEEGEIFYNPAGTATLDQVRAGGIATAAAPADLTPEETMMTATDEGQEEEVSNDEE